MSKKWSVFLLSTLMVLMLFSSVTEKSFAATRPIVTCNNGIVAAAHPPLASQAGLQILMQGGNAIDAAIATAAVLGVVEPDFSSIAAGGALMIYDASTEDILYINANAPNPRGRDLGCFNQGYCPTRLSGGHGTCRAQSMAGVFGKVRYDDFGPGVSTGDRICRKGLPPSRPGYHRRLQTMLRSFLYIPRPRLSFCLMVTCRSRVIC